MDVRQLSALVAIADHGTFSAAARALFTVQSNVSSHIARLEKELGVTSSTAPRADSPTTAPGRRAGPADPARDRRDHRRHGAARRPTSSGDVRIGMIGTTARWLMPLLSPGSPAPPQRPRHRRRGQHDRADPAC